MKELKKRIDTLETALKVIHTWASYHYEHYEDFYEHQNRKNLLDIAKKCKEALKTNG